MLANFRDVYTLRESFHLENPAYVKEHLKRMESPFKESRKVSIDNKIINVNSQLDTEGSVLAQMIDTSNENKP